MEHIRSTSTYLLQSASRNFLIASSDYSDLAFAMMKEVIVSCRAIFWQFFGGAMNGDGVAYHFLHRPHCTRDKIMSDAPSHIKPLLPETHRFCSQFFSASTLSTFASGPTHSAVIPFVDPKLIQSPFPFWTRAKSAPYLVAALTQVVNYRPSVTHRDTSVAGARKDPHYNSNNTHSALPRFVLMSPSLAE